MAGMPGTRMAARILRRYAWPSAPEGDLTRLARYRHAVLLGDFGVIRAL